MYKRQLPIRADFDDPFGKEQIICAAAAVKSARLFRVDLRQRHSADNRSVRIIGRDRIAALRRVHSDRFSICIKIERRISPRKERQRIAALRKPLQKELAKVEKELAQKNEELRKLSDRLADGDFYTMSQIDARLRELREQLLIEKERAK